MSRRERNREDTLKRRTVLTLFRKMVRSIIFNSLWLTPDEEDPFAKKKHISLVMRRKRKVGSLTAADKAAIRMPHKNRSIADRKRLCDVFSKLRCFEGFPPKIRARLVPVIKFMSIAAGRVVMKKEDFPFTMYFILTGEVEMIQRSHNKLFGKELDQVECIFGPGDCIGDVAIMENTTRSHTFVTATHCELLVLPDYGMPILEPFMKKLWTDKKRALKALDYFDFLNEDQIINACRFGSIRQFNPLDTIYSQDKGSLTNVHFVLSGECIILQCLNMKVIYVVLMLRNRHQIKIKKKKHKISKKYQDEQYEYLNFTDKDESEEVDETLYKYKKGNLLINMEEQSSNSTKSEVFTLSSSQSSSYSSDSSDSDSHFVEIDSDSSDTAQYESHFIDVGSLTYGGIFGLGEKMEDRVILARTTVQCLTLPRYFLLEKEQNPGNIWQRRLFYLDCTIPSREALFTDYVRSRNWKEFKKNFIYKNLDSNVKDISKQYDIPIICRIVETANDE
ncbi:cyclic nucleotide-binding domain-containing protein 2 [Drosophila tropicalis]|uniref:cyclic nucleotide-binding domain-containing protein 2 n=1 Tax=Drosophila tropicalis TaxID=46794 RepID=UPI0035AB9C29